MLTRDIHLEDAILDLLDNCVDDILRSSSKKDLSRDEPYKNYWAEIEFSEDSFSIQDNCGGIPWSSHDYAFRMGRPRNRPPDAKPTVGVYGIGMKLAIFKIGEDCTIETKHKDNAYCIRFSPEWIENETDWNIKPTQATIAEDGTSIRINKLNEGAKALFGHDRISFSKDLYDKIPCNTGIRKVLYKPLPP